VSAVELLAAPPKPGLNEGRAILPPYETICSTCGGPAYALGGGSLWCLRCLEPLIVRGGAFQASIAVRRAVTA